MSTANHSLEDQFLSLTTHHALYPAIDPAAAQIGSASGWKFAEERGQNSPSTEPTDPVSGNSFWGLSEKMAGTAGLELAISAVTV